MLQLRFNASHSARSVAVLAKPRKKPDYASRRAGQQEENLRRRENYHQHALSARVSRDARDDGDVVRARSHRGVMLSHATRRRGRPAHRRSPSDSPLRDGNRDRLIGMLTLRAAKTLEYYFMETNLAYHSWLQEYCRQNPIPLEGSWDAVSGEDFLRNLLTAGVYETKYSGGVTNPLFCSFGSIGIDPRAIGQRIMDIRSALAKEFIEDLTDVAEENAILMRECAMASLTALSSMDTDEEEAGMAVTPHPEMLNAEPGAIPDTVGEFMSRAVESDVERYYREREEKGEDASTEASTPSVDEVRPGLDDINEFEAELEAPDKWARRFRILRESEAASEQAEVDRVEKGAESKDGDKEQVRSAQSAIEEAGEESAALDATAAEAVAKVDAVDEAVAKANEAAEPKDGSNVAPDSPSEDCSAPPAPEASAQKQEANSSAQEQDPDSSGKGKGGAK